MQDHQPDARAHILKVADRLFYEQRIKCLAIRQSYFRHGLNAFERI